MLFINPIRNAAGAERYFREHLSQSDYYVEGQQQVIAQWEGRAAALLELSGNVDLESFGRLMRNRHPQTNQKLTKADVANAKPAYDMTFDAPKWATLAHQIGGDEAVAGAMRSARQKTMQAMEDAMQARVRKQGASYDRTTANMVYAGFVHNDTRPLDDGTSDCHDHEHVVVANKTYDAEEDQWKAGQFGQIKADGLYYQSLYHAYFAKTLADADYAIERDGNSFQLVGMDRALIDKFSRRTAVIEAEAEKRDITDDKQKSQLGKKTRNRKSKVLTQDERRAEWIGRCTPEEIAFLKNAKDGSLTGNQATAKESVDYAIAHCFQSHAVVTEKRLMAEALMHGVGSVLPDEISAEAKRRTNLLYRTEGGVRYVTTQAWKEAEQKLAAFVRDGRGTCRKILPKDAPLSDTLADDQRKAAEHILTSRDRVIGLIGAAGAGKSYLMEQVKDALVASGQWGGAFAPSTQASRKNLRESGFHGADTVAKLLADEKMQKQLAGKVVFIDEVGQMSVPDLNKVFALADKHRYRLIIAGDAKQHGPVEGPSALAIIEKYSGLQFAQLTKTRRQIVESYRQAVDDIRAGNVKTPDGKSTYLERAIERLDADGCIIELPREQLYQRAAQDYLDTVAQRGPKGKAQTAVLVTPTHEESANVAREIREGLRDVGRLSGRDRSVPTLTDLGWSDAKRGQAVNYTPGLVVQFNQNAKGIKRGERFIVIGRSADKVTIARNDNTRIELPLEKAGRFSVYRQDTQALAVGDLIRPTKNGLSEPEMRNGRAVRREISNGDVYKISRFLENGDIVCGNGLVIPGQYGHLRTGYTLTSYSSQSRTVDQAFISITEKAMTAANIEQLYVSLSRGKTSAVIYTDNKEALLDAVKRTSLKRSATDLLDESRQTQEGSSLRRRLTATQAVKRAYRSVAARGRELTQTIAQQVRGLRHG